MTRMSEIPPELLAEMTPAVRAFVESLFVQMAEMQARMQAEIDELKAQVKKLTPKNSSVPPSTQHPHAREAAKPKPKTWCSRLLKLQNDFKRLSLFRRAC